MHAKWSWPKVIMIVYADHDDNWWQPLQRVVVDNWGSQQSLEDDSQ